MSEELAEVDFQRFWRRLQQLGLNAYESRSYLVLLGHPKFKALELAARARATSEDLRSAGQPGGEGIRSDGSGEDEALLGGGTESGDSGVPFAQAADAGAGTD